MIGSILFYAFLIASLGIGFVYFRDLGDISQMVLRVKRENILRFIRHEKLFIAIGVGSFVLATFAHLALGGGTLWVWLLGGLLVLFLYGFPWVWVHLGLRNQKESAKYYGIDKGRKFVNPSASVMVIENGGVARAHSDAQLMRPHLAGDAQGLGGENVIMTYCAMANLGQGYRPEIEGKPVDLEVLAQHGNNLILRDNATGEPIQQIYGFREGDQDPNETGPACPVRPQARMDAWPTFRMSFRGFQKAYPDGQVFLNMPSANPLLRLLDLVTETAFTGGIAKQHQEDRPVMDNMSRSDDRLLNKTYIWGVSIGNDAACWTDDFVVEQGGIVNARVGDRDLVVHYSPRYESLGVWYNDTGSPVHEIDFFGKSDRGQLTRVESLRPGMFWHVWAEFFPNTDINRGVGVSAAQGASDKPVQEPSPDTGDLQVGPAS